MKIELNMTGDLKKSLDALEAGMKEHVVRSAANAGAVLLYEEARLRAPVYAGDPRKGIKPGQLRNAIYHAYSESKSSDVVKTYEITWNKKKAPHGYLVEYGHWIVVSTRLGSGVAGPPQRVGRVPAIPFIRGSFDRAQDAIKAMRDRAAERTAEVLAGKVGSE